MAAAFSLRSVYKIFCFCFLVVSGAFLKLLFGSLVLQCQVQVTEEEVNYHH